MNSSPSMIKPTRKSAIFSADVLGVSVDGLSAGCLLEEIEKYIQSEDKAIIANVNIHALNLAYRLTWFKSFFQQARIVFCDGAGVVLGARILGGWIAERITYADWMWQLAAFGEENHFTFFFLGAKPGVAELAAAKLRARFPNLTILGTHHGYFDKTPESPENQALIQRINQLKPDILLVGFGMPLQERWLMENWDSIDAHVALTGGAVFDYISGELRRPPRWMTGHGLEWLGRLIIEPRRLWRRYLIGNPLFFYRVLRQRFTQGRRPAPSELTDS